MTLEEEIPWWEDAETEEETTDLVVRDPGGVPRRLGPLLFSGGEGEVRPLEADPAKLVKLYHPRVLADEARTARIRDKVRALLGKAELKEDSRFGWPQLPVFDETGKWTGFAMRRCEGVILHHLCAPVSARETFPGWDRAHLLRLCLNLVDGLNTLHRNGVMIGDVNTGNFLVREDASVSFIDCDSYYLGGSSGPTHPCEVRTDLFTPPELLDLSPREVRRRPEHELFSDAILFYQVLMLGAHPYSHRQGEDPVENLRAGRCPLGRGADCLLPAGPWRNLWSHLTYNLKSLFLETFREGHGDPTARPYLRRWKSALIDCLKVIECEDTTNSRELVPKAPKSNAYKGTNATIRSRVEARPAHPFARTR